MKKRKQDVALHICRVQNGSVRQWWVQSQRRGLDLVKSRESMKKTIAIWKRRNPDCEVISIVRYQGICTPAEAAMTLGQVCLTAAA